MLPKLVAQRADIWTPPLPVQTISPSALLYFVYNIVTPLHPQALSLPGICVLRSQLLLSCLLPWALLLEQLTSVGLISHSN